MPGFLKMHLSGKLVSVCVCVCVCMCMRVCPQAIKNHSREIKIEQPIKQVLVLFSFLLVYMTLAINITDRHGLSNKVHCAKEN